MRYFKEYLVSVYNEESLQAESVGLASVPLGDWARCFIDFGLVSSFYEHKKEENQIICEYRTGKSFYLNVSFEQFKHDFEEYLKQANKPFWSMQ